ncbi:peptidylprolyl isomerase [Neobacillus cucumis]|uniref:peptidylprolyl isomerase n=1 Tax=Neobacillus cucumis TaxID=1740721 RepID=UPI00285360FC|nr:peptidylprolyl isomerase [Neobacillus cucumis]MDR4945188.1 peptidylprolyl isomerase [Neobacillus cucumis]
MKKWIVLLGMAAGILSLSACANSDIIVQSKVGNITKEEFYNQLKKQAGDKVLQQMVDTMLLEKKYKVTDKEVAAKIKDYTNQFGGEAGLKQALAQNGISNQQAFKNMVKEQLLAEKASTDGVEISEQDVKKEYENNYKEEVRASHILVNDEKTAKEVKTKLDHGEDFAKLAGEYSIDPGSKDKGGNLGYFTKGKMVPEFDNAVFSMAVGKVSNPVKTQYGYHIIKVTDKKINKFEDVKDEIKKELMMKKSKPIDTMITKLQKDADISIKDKDLKIAFKNS